MTALGVAFALLFSASAVDAVPLVDCRADQVVFLDGTRQIPVQVEIADDLQERAQGLMFRKTLAPGTGMLFVYQEPAPVSFWMRNTLIYLDMIFIDAQGVIRHIHPNARPLDETSVPGALPGDPDPARLLVVEVPGGDAARLGLRAGMPMAHPAVPQNRAIAPCK